MIVLFLAGGRAGSDASGAQGQLLLPLDAAPGGSGVSAIASPSTGGSVSGILACFAHTSWPYHRTQTAAPRQAASPA
jgi:hypothetical protein